MEEKTVTSYVLGYIFDKNVENVLLLKRSPEHKTQANLFNGVGGKIEENETIYNAMDRESIEEIGFTPADWSHTVTIIGKTHIIYVFRAFDDLSKAQKMENDDLYVVSLKNIPSDCVEDVDWSLLFSKDRENELPITIFKKGAVPLY